MEEQSLQAQLMRTMHRFKRVNLAAATDGLTRGEFFLLEMLGEDRRRHPDTEGMYAGMLAGAARMSAPAVSRFLRAMEGKDFIERSVDPVDRRNTRIRLTDAGARALATEKERIQRLMDRVFTAVGTEDMRTLLVLFTRVLDTLEQEIAAENNQAMSQNEGGAECSKFSNT